MGRSEYTLEDFVRTMRQVLRFGPPSRWVGMLPAMRGLTLRLGGEIQVRKQMARMEGIYNAMTPAERHEHELVVGERRRRVARGAGVGVVEVGQFLKQFEAMREVIGSMRTSRVTRRPAMVAGLVTDNPARRDPSWVWPVVRWMTEWEKPIGWGLAATIVAVVVIELARRL